MAEPRFQGFERLGQGTYGQVFTAKDKKTNKDVVVKRIPKKRHEDNKRISNEIKANTMLKGRSRSFCGFHGYIDNTRETSLVFDVIRGIDLFTLMERRSFEPMEEKVVCKIVKKVASALHSCHRMGIAHRDVKLENIMMDLDKNRIFLVDFGLCTFFQTVDGKESQSVDYCGSAEYMSPEITKQTPLRSTLVDAWALGVTTFALLFGRFPYALHEMMQNFHHCTSIPLPDNTDEIQVSHSTREKLSRLLTIDPEKRATTEGPPPSARAVGTNQPEKRQHLILAELERRLKDVQLIINTEGLSDDGLMSVHSRELIDFLKIAYEEGMRVNDDDWWTPEGGLVPYTFALGLSDADKKALLPTLPVYLRCGIFAKDMSTPILLETWHRATTSAKNSVMAAEMLMRDPSLIYYAINSSPGHHATRDHYGGYCFFNNAALAACKLRELGAKRVGLLDLDYHAGDGAQQIFWRRGDVVTASIHGELDYPIFWGLPHQRGEGEGEGTNYNLPLPTGATFDQHYSPALTSVTEWLKRLDITHLVVAFGSDTLEGDPDPSNLRGMKLQPDDFIQMGRQLREEMRGIPIMITNEGGYLLSKVPEAVVNFIGALCNQIE
ncbi:histone deacetylase superfamily protein [Planoprotostelium fungivorum]|uniref:Histone deacetylase superfamily protein n=1 Tax=Planoprotostelium fungivorum TaxID=1890364 RepID=A0A2P6NQA8_9EUKA|nr:histone deacetylase superfamily protein [Planoprotostelium fungivorum]